MTVRVIPPLPLTVSYLWKILRGPFDLEKLLYMAWYKIWPKKYFTLIFLLHKWMTNRPSEKGKLQIESKGSESCTILYSSDVVNDHWSYRQNYSLFKMPLLANLISSDDDLFKRPMKQEGNSIWIPHLHPAHNTMLILSSLVFNFINPVKIQWFCNVLHVIKKGRIMPFFD